MNGKVLAGNDYRINYRYGNTDILFAVTEFIDDFSGIPEAINIEKNDNNWKQQPFDG